jgi:hypothetical protein
MILCYLKQERKIEAGVFVFEDLMLSLSVTSFIKIDGYARNKTEQIQRDLNEIDGARQHRCNTV